MYDLPAELVVKQALAAVMDAGLAAERKSIYSPERVAMVEKLITKSG